MRSFWDKIKHMDVMLAVICLLLLLVGLTLIYSTTIGSVRTAFYRQLAYAAAGIVLFMFFASVDFKQVTRGSRYVYVITFILLIAVLFTPRILGSHRWFNIGFFNLQPAEVAKLAVVLVLARFFALRRGEINTWQNLLISFVYIALPAALIAREPDLGSAIIVGVIWLGVLLLSNVQKKIFVYLFLFLAVFSALAWTTMLHDYQRNRIETFLDPNRDPKGRGYNVLQARIAVGSGGLWGRGLGKGLQSQLKFLPERQTDFIFASASEELGFIGSVVILILYLILLYRLLIIYHSSRDDLGRFVIAGIFFMIFAQVVINVGMNIGIMPVTGIPLPFLSYGGSSLLTIAVALGIAEAVAIQSKGLRLG